jgi:choice-of-anchor B domain-containing protein
MLTLRIWLIIAGLMAGLSGITAQELQKIGHLSYFPRSLSGCWHHVDSSGGEWALVGTSTGLSIVDLSDPTFPEERFLVPGIMNNWREVRTWDGFAYVGSEAALSGITIVDLRQLPDTVYSKVWRGDGAYDSLIVKSHTVQTKDGYLYIFGGIGSIEGALIADLADPWNPKVVGLYDEQYVHDGFIRGDTLWTSEIYDGWFAAVDISDRSNPVLLATQPTPFAFTHNTELNGAGNVMFSTDERIWAPLASYDVSNLDDIKLLDLYLPTRKPSGEVHNVRVFNDFLINPSYRGQLTIVDASRPENLIETAWDSLGNSLVWDADPYLPSGIILATAKLEGFYVYQKPQYRHACWLEGIVSDALTDFPLSNVKVYLANTYYADTSRSNGVYRTGHADPGNYTITAFKEGYWPFVLDGVALETNQVTNLNIKLTPIQVSVSEAHQTEPTVSPMPFSSSFILEFPENNVFTGKNCRFWLIDAAGKTCWSQSMMVANKTELTGLDHLPQGVYSLVLKAPSGEQAVVKVVK